MPKSQQTKESRVDQIKAFGTTKPFLNRTGIQRLAIRSGTIKRVGGDVYEWVQQYASSNVQQIVKVLESIALYVHHRTIQPKFVYAALKFLNQDVVVPYDATSSAAKGGKGKKGAGKAAAGEAAAVASTEEAGAGDAGNGDTSTEVAKKSGRRLKMTNARMRMRIKREQQKDAPVFPAACFKSMLKKHFVDINDDYIDFRISDGSVNIIQTFIENRLHDMFSEAGRLAIEIGKRKTVSKEDLEQAARLVK